MNCINYWKTRAKLAEAVIAENQIGAWKKWDEMKKTEPPEIDKEKIINYIYDFAWEYGRYWNTSLSNKEIMKKLKERIKTPKEFINETFS